MRLYSGALSEILRYSASPPSAYTNVHPDPSWGGGFLGRAPPLDPGEENTPLRTPGKTHPPLRAGRQAGTEYVYSLFRLASEKTNNGERDDDDDDDKRSGGAMSRWLDTTATEEKASDVGQSSEP